LGEHLAFSAKSQPTLVIPIMLGKFLAGVIAIGIAIYISVPAAQRMEKIDDERESAVTGQNILPAESVP